jgi:MFS family permease
MSDAAARNIRLYPWFQFCQNLLFWQSTWFLFFQSELSAAQAILIYVFADIATTLLEVPSGYLSDRIGRRVTLLLSALAGLVAALLQAVGSDFWVFALAQVALGTHLAFASGTDSALLYESLEETGREAEVEAQEVRAWRFAFAALAMSAVTGGAMALWGLRIPYFATVAAFVATLIVVFRFREPERLVSAADEWTRLNDLFASFRSPVILWLFAISLLMYGYSHIPFVFGQPFILSALEGLGLAAEAPLVSGSVTTAMMLLSLAASWAAPGIRKRIGFAGILLLAFAMQVALVAGLAATGSALAIGLLLLRMVPDSFSQPFVRARIQPLLKDEVRATFLSLKSLAGRLLFAASLWLASSGASDVGAMSHGEIRSILLAYALAGLLAFSVLLLSARGRGI